jgi:uncharacterized protein YheU (UPF0270 family)
MIYARMSAEHEQEPVVVPYTALAADTLRAVVESYVLREGTEYGERDFTLAEKVAHVMRQLERGEARIIFEPISQSIAIVPAAHAPSP